MTELEKKVLRAERRVLRQVFAAGEHWGVTHSGWFVPTKQIRAEKVRLAVAGAMSSLSRLRRKS